MSDGETYRVDVSRAAKHWCLMRDDLGPVEIRGGGTRLYWPRLWSEMSVATLIGTTEERLATCRATLAGLIGEGKVTPAIHGDTTTLSKPTPATTGMTATETLLAERRTDPR